jgi:hypothetical protein
MVYSEGLVWQVSIKIDANTCKSKITPDRLSVFLWSAHFGRLSWLVRAFARQKVLNPEGYFHVDRMNHGF